MALLLLVLQVATLAIIVLFGQKFFPAYVSKKAENLATKEDVAEITKRTEAARTPYLAEIENIKHQLQEHSRVYSERQRLYVDFAEAVAKVFVAGRGATDQDVSAFYAKYAAVVLSAPDDIVRAANKHLEVQRIAAQTRKFSELQPDLQQTLQQLILAMRRDGFYPETVLVGNDYRLDTIEIDQRTPADSQDPHGEVGA